MSHLEQLKPNILFIVVDSLRSDKCIDSTKTSITPNIDFLTKNGVSFSQTISTVATTIPSLGSIFSSNFPNKAGLSVEKFDQLNLDSPNYLRTLQQYGYNTYATMPEIATDFGLICDFKNNDSSYDNYFGLFKGLGNKILEKLSSKEFQSPWFLYVHLFDLHTPIVLPDEYKDAKFGESNYEKMISAMDYWLGKIINEIDLEKTLIIITADHGEYVPVIRYNNELLNFESSDSESKLWMMGNKVPPKLYPIKKKVANVLRAMRANSKKSKLENLSLTKYQKRVLLESRMTEGHRMYDDLLKVPFLIVGPGIPKNKIISQQVRHVDIFPTIAELVKIKPDFATDGISLIPLINGEDVDELPAYIESPPTITGDLKKVIGIRTSEFKFLKSLDETKTIFELYDLKNDPLEENNIAETSSEIISSLNKQLSKLISNNISPKQNLSDTKKQEIREKLKKLGYA